MAHTETSRLLNDKESPLSRYYIPRRYIMVALMHLAILICYVFRVTLSVAIISISKEYHWSDDTKGLVLSAFFWGYITTQFLGGYLSLKIGGKITLAIGVLWPAFFTCVTPFTAWNVPLLITCRVLTGFGEGVLFPTIYNLAGRWMPFEQRGMLLAIATAGAYTGTVVGTEMSPPIIDALGWQWVFLITGIAGGLWVVLWVILGADKPSTSWITHVSEAAYIESHLDKRPTTMSTQQTIASGIQYNNDYGDDGGKPGVVGSETESQSDRDFGEQKTGFQALMMLIRHLSFWACVFCALAVNWGFYVLLTWLPTYYEDLHFSLSMAGLMSVMPSVCTLIFSVIGGKINDFLMARKAKPIHVRKAFFALGNVLPITALLMVSFLPLSRNMIAAVLAIGIGGQGFNTAGLNVLLLEMAPKHASIVVGITNTAGTIPGIVGVASTGFLLTAFHGAWAAVFMVPVFFYTLGIIVFTFFASSKRLV